MEIKNQIAIVSGGGSGMGAATAKMLRQRGALVAIFDRDEAAAKQVAGDIDALAFACDVTNADTVSKAIESVIKELGTPRICVNCAGIVKGRRIVSKQGPMDLQEFRDVIEVNLIGTFNLMRLVAEQMTLAEPVNDSMERGVIINTASIAAFEGQIGQCAYSASKGGVVGLTVPAARDLAQFGVRVMTIAPGLVDTPMLQKIPEEARQALIANVPFPHRLVKPEEFAQLVCHIVENAMLNAEVIRLDGALRMQPK